MPARQTRWRTILSFSVCKCGHFNRISHQSAQKTRNMESELHLCGVTELKKAARDILNNFEILIAVLFPNTTTSPAITYTNVADSRRSL